VKRYPKYKDSGVPWLGQIPSHWQVKKLKRAFSEISDKAKPGDEQLAATQKFGVISQSQFMKEQDQKLVLALKGTDNFKHLEKDDFVISLRAFEGGIERSSQSGCVSPAYTVLRSKGEVSPGFAARLLKTPEFISQISMTYDGIREGKAIKFKDAGPVPLPIPPSSEQSAITSFIDGVIFKMDSAIASQERMIELLKERRSAIITQAVTKGLDSKAKMKDSGVPWLGQVPAHWEVKRLRHLVQIKASNVDKKTVEGEPAVRLCNYTDVYYNERIVMGAEYMEASASEDQIKKLGLKVGDVIITKDSEEPDDIGIPACVYETAPDFVCGYHLALLRPADPALGPFIARSISSVPSKVQFHLSAKGVTRFALGYHGIADMSLMLPPRHEALAICDFLDRSLADMDSAISAQERMIELLKERRSAIITQAVTGQIDVR